MLKAFAASAAFTVAALPPRQQHARFLVSSAGSGEALQSMLSGYESLVASGRLRPDPSQRTAAEALQVLQRAYQEAVAAGSAGGTATSAVPLLQPQQQPQPPQPPLEPEPLGAYLFGSVGSGKSLLMDLFFRTAPGPKKRLHFHEFMLGVHASLHALQQGVPRVVRRSAKGLPVHRFAQDPDTDPLDKVAESLARECRLLCLDEMQVTDVADAMILNRLFLALRARGVWAFFTSNTAPWNLYANGLSRRYFVPFVENLESRSLVLRLAPGRDFRLVPPRAEDEGDESEPGAALVDAVPRGGFYRSRKEFNFAWEALRQSADCATSAEESVTLPVAFGRSITLPRVLRVRDSSAGGGTSPTGVDEASGASSGGRTAVRIQLRDFLGRLPDGSALGPADYLAVAAFCSEAFLEGAGMFAPSQLDEARRFVSLIDVLYERRATLRVLSACSPEGIFERLLSVSSTPPLGILQQKQRGTRGEGDAAGGSSVGGSDRGGLPPPLPPPAAAIRPDPDVHECRPLTREERLMCLRTVSRLRQMCPPPAATPSPPSGGASPPVV